MSEPDEMLLLNEVTGIVHEYNGTGPGGYSSDEADSVIGVLPCGCEDDDLFAEAVEMDNLIMIERRHLEKGIWEPAPCVETDEEISVSDEQDGKPGIKDWGEINNV